VTAKRSGPIAERECAGRRQPQDVGAVVVAIGVRVTPSKGRRRPMSLARGRSPWATVTVCTLPRPVGRPPSAPRR